MFRSFGTFGSCGAFVATSCAIACWTFLFGLLGLDGSLAIVDRDVSGRSSAVVARCADAVLPSLLAPVGAPGVSLVFAVGVVA